MPHGARILQFLVFVVIWVSDSIVWLSLESECDKEWDHNPILKAMGNKEQALL